MSIFELEDYLIFDKGSEALKKQFENYCSWCWGHGYGNCDICRKRFNKYYIQIRKKELIDRMNERNDMETIEEKKKALYANDIKNKIKECI